MLALFENAGGALMVVAALALVSHHYWEQLYAGEKGRGFGRFLGWVCRGLLAPMLIWMGFNSGLVTGVPPLWPTAALVRATAGSGFAAWIETLASSWLVIGTFWAAATFGRILAIMAFQVPHPREVARSAAIWGLILSPIAWLILRGCGPAGLGLAGLVLLLPAVHFNLPLLDRPEPRPMYSQAIAKLKFGKYGDAELALIKELDKFQDDFEGWMMLADLYANQFHELPEADRTIRELCGQPEVTGVQISLAFHRLADWHLKLANDPLGARRALEEICRKLPGSHFAHMARQRLDQLPADRQELLEQRENKPIRMPALADDLDEPAARTATKMERDQAAALANQFVEKLRHNPNDSSSREKLAIVWAENLDRTELGIEQLELLMAMPNQPEPKMAEWLSLMAAWKIRYRQDPEAARRILERLIREYPHTPQAFAAQRRLSLIEMEQWAKKMKDPARKPTLPSV